MSPMIAEAFVLTEGRSIRVNDGFDVRVGLPIDGSVDLGQRAVGLPHLTPSNLHGSTLFSR